MGEITCARCQQTRPAVAKVPYSGDLADELFARICESCWSEWEKVEVMVINELRLDFMDPRAPDILVQQMREFLCLDEPSAGQG